MESAGGVMRVLNVELFELVLQWSPWPTWLRLMVLNRGSFDELDHWMQKEVMQAGLSWGVNWGHLTADLADALDLEDPLSELAKLKSSSSLGIRERDQTINNQSDCLSSKFWRRVWVSWRSERCIRCWVDDPLKSEHVKDFAPFCPVIFACRNCTRERHSCVSLIDATKARMNYHVNLASGSQYPHCDLPWRFREGFQKGRRYWEAQVKRCAHRHYGGEKEWQKIHHKAIMRPQQLKQFQTNLRRRMDERIDKEIQLGTLEPSIKETDYFQAQGNRFWNHGRLSSTTERIIQRELDHLIICLRQRLQRAKRLEAAFSHRSKEFQLLMHQKIHDSLKPLPVVLNEIHNLPVAQSRWGLQYFWRGSVTRNRMLIRQFVMMGATGVATDTLDVPLHLINSLMNEIDHLIIESSYSWNSPFASLLSLQVPPLMCS